jgi:hypothetical protein
MRMILESPRRSAPQLGADRGSFPTGRLFDIDVSLKGYVGGLFARRIDVLDCLYIVL